MAAFSDTKNVKLGVAKVTFGGVDLGYTKGGVEVEVITETHKVQIDQFGDTDINEQITARNCMVRCPLAESTLKNMVEIMPGATLVESGGTLATGTIDMGTTNAADGDTLTINGVVYTFKTSTIAEFEIQIGGTVALTLAAITAKLAAATALSVVRVTYTDNTVKILTMTYKTKAAAGNTFTHASVVTGTAWTHSNAGLLTGGVDSKQRIDAKLSIGTNLLDTAKELILHPTAKAASDTSDDFIVPLANTAGAISFAYKLDEERIFNVEFTAYPNSDTKILFKVGDKTA